MEGLDIIVLYHKKCILAGLKEQHELGAINVIAQKGRCK